MFLASGFQALMSLLHDSYEWSASMNMTSAGVTISAASMLGARMSWVRMSGRCCFSVFSVVQIDCSFSWWSPSFESIMVSLAFLRMLRPTHSADFPQYVPISIQEFVVLAWLVSHCRSSGLIHPGTCAISFSKSMGFCSILVVFGFST